MHKQPPSSAGVLTGGAAAHAAAVEQRMTSIHSILSQFERDTRDSALMSAAEHDVPPTWSAEEWAAIGRPSDDRQWLKDDLNSWAERVMERAKALEAAAPAAEDEVESAERNSGALGDAFKTSIRKLRDVGMRILHLAALGEQQKISPVVLRQEMDSTIVSSMGEFSAIVDRGLETMRQSRRVEVPPADVFRASALQQKLICKLEMQLAEREALLVTVRKESDENYHSFMRAEERARQAVSVATQKPSQRTRATHCRLPADGADAGVQVRRADSSSDSDVETNSSVVCGSNYASSPKRGVTYSTASSQKIGSFASRDSAPSPRAVAKRTGSTVSRGGPHEALILQSKLDQQRFMFAAVVALYKATLRSKAPSTSVRAAEGRSVATQTVTPAGGEVSGDDHTRQMMEQRSPPTQSDFVNDTFAAFTSAREDRERDAVWACIIGATPKPTDRKVHKAAGGRGTSARRGVGGHPTGPERAAGCEKPQEPIPTVIPPIGNLVATNSPRTRPKPPPGSDGRSLASSSTAHGHPQHSPSSATKPAAPSPPVLAAETQTERQPRVHTVEAACQTSPLQRIDAWVEAMLAAFGLGSTPGIEQSGQAQPSPLGEGVRTSTPHSGFVVSVQPPRATRVLSCDAEQHSSSSATVRFYSDEVNLAPRRSAHAPNTAPHSRRPLSSGGSTCRAPKKFTLLSDTEIAHVLDMEARHNNDIAQFSRWKEELQRLRTMDAEAVLVSPLTDVSSHHLPITRTPPPTRGASSSEPLRIPHSAAHPTLPSSAVLTGTGEIVRQPSPSRRQSPVPPPAAERPQPFRVPKIW